MDESGRAADFISDQKVSLEPFVQTPVVSKVVSLRDLLTFFLVGQLDLWTG